MSPRFPGDPSGSAPSSPARSRSSSAFGASASGLPTQLSTAPESIPSVFSMPRMQSVPYVCAFIEHAAPVAVT